MNKELLKTAIHAATSAGEHILNSARSIDALTISQKSLYDYVSEVDRDSEKIIRRIIHDAFPSHSILGEEYGQAGDSKNEYQWVVDPLDGTTNYLRSIPHYAVSVGLCCNGDIDLGVIYDPSKNELFVAQKGLGAFLNDKPISVSNTKIAGSLLATGIPFNGASLQNIAAFTSTMEGLLAMQTSGIRRLGAAALDLAYVASGRYDGFWESNLKAWDIAAGILMVTEAGGIVTNLNGSDSLSVTGDLLATGNILAANSAVHSDMLTVTNANY